MTGPAGARNLAATVGADTLAGRWGDAVRQAQADRDVIAAARAARAARAADTRLDVPDLLPTAEELLERVCSLAPTLHQLDAALAPRTVAVVEQRIAATMAAAEGERRDRQLELLERQRATLRELEERRTVLARKIDAALLALARLRYEAKRLRGR